MTLLSALDQAAVDRRLVHHQCVWCGTPLHHQHPSDLYCTADHQTAWHRWVNGHALEADTRRPSLIEQMTREYEATMRTHGIDPHTD